MDQEGAFKTGDYQNLLEIYGYSKDEIAIKIDKTWNSLFFDEDLKFYYEIDDNLAYISDTGNNDVRTEGMSYGMMAAVQLNQKEVFDRLWRWTKKYMYQPAGEYKGYFAWSCDLRGNKNSEGPAPDGEEYFAMALLFASNRWGDGKALLNYSEQAKEILHEVVHKGVDSPGDPMWNPDNYLIKFIPEVEFSDPSYHLPHFYELFARWGNEEDQDFWLKAAEASRKYIKQSCHAETGLSAEYAEYDGSPRFEEGHGDFYSDAYRVAFNIGVDSLWFRKDPWQQEAAYNLQKFFADKEEYTKYSIDGRKLEKPDYLHYLGLKAANASASLAGENEFTEKYLKDFWEAELRTDERRYYDNFLYLFALLALSGNFRIY
ncbi:oligosaccharide reducing-end xylanase [Halanaerobium saccharolyticum]|uniref:Oligosaccharide reducing-end xylanase n=1 Tax=Halanaerobium saccharolyticum TaxID=43595 RepID=A0A4R6LYN6_9FIRM|nr:glycosyl hydrolase family 8 [Halanaerobium saccharolyticum]TDO93884.1 oligosaccharide reducing-end xylanase [Halanaerobium saccharolyticum]